jgi:bile acid:Na+ symporter, BASS family
MMFALGTSLRVQDLYRVLGRPGAFAFGSLAHALLLPLLAIALAHVLSLPGPLAIGLVLIASCPANATSNLFTYLARGDTMLSICLTAGASLTSALTLPFFVKVALAAFGAGAVRLPLLPSALGLFLISTLPVLAGMGLRRFNPALACRIENGMSGFGLIFIVVVLVLAIWSERANVVPALIRAGPPALALNLLAVTFSWAGSGLARLPRGQRVAISLECGLQNFALAAFVSLTLLREPAFLLPAIAYGLTMWLSAIAIVVLARRQWVAAF